MENLSNKYKNILIDFLFEKKMRNKNKYITPILEFLMREIEDKEISVSEGNIISLEFSGTPIETKKFVENNTIPSISMTSVKNVNTLHFDIGDIISE